MTDHEAMMTVEEKKAQYLKSRGRMDSCALAFSGVVDLARSSGMKDEEIISAFKEAGGSEPPDLEELDDVSKAFLRSVLPADAAPQLLPECPQQ